MIKWKEADYNMHSSPFVILTAYFNLGISISIKECNEVYSVVIKIGNDLSEVDGIPSLEDAKLFAEKELIKYLVNEIGGEIVEFKGKTYFAKF